MTFNRYLFFSTLVVLIVFVILVSVFYDKKQCPSIKEILASLDPIERKKLERFFDYLMRNEMFAHSLFGEKPMAIANCCTNPKYLPYFGSSDWNEDFIVRKGCETWKNIESRFPSKNFILKISLDPLNSMYSLLLINKQESLKVLEENKDLFEKFIGHKFSSEELLNKIEVDDPILHDQTLLGILLGFGRENSLSFARRIELESYLEQKNSLPCINCSKVTEAEEEYNHLIAAKMSFQPERHGYMTKFTPDVAFVAFVDSKELRQKYAKAAEKITAAFQDKPVLETFLECYTSSEKILDSTMNPALKDGE